MTTNIVSLPTAKRHLASVSDTKKSCASSIARTKQEEFAIKLREIARKIEIGDVQFAAVMLADEAGKTEEYILPYRDVSRVRRGK
jgi:hypothetical protein